MAQCTQLIQTATAQTLSPAPASPSPTPLIWAPLVQAPLQAAAATTPLALALAHHSQLPPILFHHPLASDSGSFKDPSGHPKIVHVEASTASGDGSGPGSPASSTKFRSGVDSPILASLRAQHLHTAPVSPTLGSQPTFTSNLQPLAQPAHEPQPHPPMPTVFPISQAHTAQLHLQPPHGAMPTSPHQAGYLHQGAVGRPIVRFPAPSASTISPLISSSVGSILSQLQQSSHASTQQMESSHGRVARTSSGQSLPHCPFTTSIQSSSGFLPEQPAAGTRFGAPSYLAQHTVAGLQSVFLPQVLPEHSALASLAQYGSGDGSPCYTPPVHSPNIQSPVRARTVYHSELPSTVGSHIPLSPQTSCPARVACPIRERAKSSLDLFTQEITTISSSLSLLPQEGPLASGHFSDGSGGPLSPFSFSSAAGCKPYSPIPGQNAPLSWTHSGPEPQSQVLGVQYSHPRSPARMSETEHKDSKLPSNL